MRRTGVALSAEPQRSGGGARLGLPRPPRRCRRSGPLSDGRLGEWDKVRLLSLLRSAAGPAPGACVSGCSCARPSERWPTAAGVALAPRGRATGGRRRSSPRGRRRRWTRSWRASAEPWTRAARAFSAPQPSSTRRTRASTRSPGPRSRPPGHSPGPLSAAAAAALCGDAAGTGGGRRGVGRPPRRVRGPPAAGHGSVRGSHASSSGGCPGLPTTAAAGAAAGGAAAGGEGGHRAGGEWGGGGASPARRRRRRAWSRSRSPPPRGGARASGTRRRCVGCRRRRRRRRRAAAAAPPSARAAAAVPRHHGHRSEHARGSLLSASVRAACATAGRCFGGVLAAPRPLTPRCAGAPPLTLRPSSAACSGSRLMTPMRPACVRWLRLRPRREPSLLNSPRASEGRTTRCIRRRHRRECAPTGFSSQPRCPPKRPRALSSSDAEAAEASHERPAPPWRRERRGRGGGPSRARQSVAPLTRSSGFELQLERSRV